MEPAALVSPCSGVCAWKRSLRVAGDCGCGAACGCTLEPCCQEHRRYALFRKEQRRRCSADTGRLQERRCAFWARLEHEFDALPSRKRPPRATFARALQVARDVALDVAELEALEELSFAAVWRGLLKLRAGARDAFWYREWVRATQLAHDRVVAAGRELRWGASFGQVFSRFSSTFAALLGGRGARPVSGCCVRLSVLRLQACEFWARAGRRVLRQRCCRRRWCHEWLFAAGACGCGGLAGAAAP